MILGLKVDTHIMRDQYTFKEARIYLGVSPDRLRSLLQKNAIEGIPNPNDERSIIYTAQDIQSLKIQINRATNSNFIAVLNVDLARSTANFIAHELAGHLETRIAVVYVPSEEGKTAIATFPFQPSSSTSRTHIYNLSLCSPPTPSSFLLSWHNLYEWLHNLATKYVKVLIFVEKDSPLTDQVIVCSDSISVIEPYLDSHNLKDLENRIKSTNRLRHGYGARLDAIILANSEKISAESVPPGVLVTTEVEAPAELLQFWYRKTRGRPRNAEPPS